MDHPRRAKGASAGAPPLYGDVLDAVVSRVPALDLVPASRVSREWSRAVRSSASSRRAPWLLLHPLRQPPPPPRRPRRPPSSSYAFDPHSRAWLRLPPPPNNNNINNNDDDDDNNNSLLLLPVVASGGSRLCALSLSAMSVSADPFGAAAWRRFGAPRVWRQDPVVALAGPHLVVLGGACDLGLALADGDDAAAASSVEVLSNYNSPSSSSGWQPCGPMPAAFDGSTSALWLSAAASERRVYVVERRTALASWFDPESRSWGPVRLLRPDGGPPVDVSSWAAAVTATSERDSLILIGVSGKRKKSCVKVHAWEVEGDSLEILPTDGRRDEMPQDMADRLFLSCYDDDDDDDDDDDAQEEDESSSGRWWPCLIGSCAAGGCGYVYDRAEPRKGMVMFEVERDVARKAGGLIRRWEWVPCPAALQQDNCFYHYAADKVAVGCSAVELDDIAAALASLRPPP